MLTCKHGTHFLAVNMVTGDRKIREDGSICGEMVHRESVQYDGYVGNLMGNEIFG